MMHSDLIATTTNTTTPGSGGSAGGKCAVIRVFPATAWPEAEFHKLRALGGLLVSARKVAGAKAATQFVRVEALTPGPVEERGTTTSPNSTTTASESSKCVTLVVAGWDGGALPVVSPPSSVTVQRSVTDGAPSVTFELLVGQHVVLSPAPRNANVGVGDGDSAAAAAAAASSFSIASLADNKTEYHWLGYRQKVSDMVMQCSGDWPS
jgi:hypothetical protein